MSYNIGICEFPIPNNFHKACAVFSSFAHDESNEIHPKYQAFYEAISKIYPCICDLPEDKEDDGVWCDAPLINNFKTKAPIIGFVYSQAEAALPTVIELATKMGLSVLDWQTETIYLAKNLYNFGQAD